MWNTICYVLPSQRLDALEVSPWSDCTKFAPKKQLPKNVQKKGFRYFHENPCGSIALAERVGFEQDSVTRLNILSFMIFIGVKTEFYTRIYTNSFLLHSD